MTKIKICGLKTPEAVLAAVRARADYIGFVFAKSPRQICVEKAAQLAQLVPSSTKIVGVFRSPSLADLTQTIRAVPLDLVQLHGSELPQSLETIGVPIIRAVGVDASLNHLAFPQADFLLFDAPTPGSGRTFDWATLSNRVICQPFFIAGGLNEHNILHAIATFSPYAVDVSSGVETNGEKDCSKIKALIERVHHVSATK